MRYVVTILMVLMVAILGCVKAPKTDASAPAIDAENTETADGEFVYEPGTWIENWDNAIETARAQDKTVLVNFTGSDWCGWCIRLVKEVFDHQEFKDYAKENLVLLKLDFPRAVPQSDELKSQNRQLQAQFGIRGYPTILLVSGEGKEIGRTGYQDGGPANYVNHLKSFVK